MLYIIVMFIVQCTTEILNEFMSPSSIIIIYDKSSVYVLFIIIINIDEND